MNSNPDNDLATQARHIQHAKHVILKMTHVVHFLLSGVCIHIDELLSVKASITSLWSGTSIGDLEVYFETICDNDKVEILSTLILGGGKAEVVLKGLTADGKNM